MPEKIMRVDINEEEMAYVIRSINLANTVVSGDWGGQIAETISLAGFLASDPHRMGRLASFRVRIAKLTVGPERVEQILKDLESEANAKGWEKCPDCGGWHA